MPRSLQSRTKRRCKIILWAAALVSSALACGLRSRRFSASASCQAFSWFANMIMAFTQRVWLASEQARRHNKKATPVKIECMFGGNPDSRRPADACIPIGLRPCGPDQRDGWRLITRDERSEISSKDFIHDGNHRPANQPAQ